MLVVPVLKWYQGAALWLSSELQTRSTVRSYALGDSTYGHATAARG